MHLSLHFLVLRAIILYHIMILLLSLLSLIDAPHQLFIWMEYTAYDTNIVASLRSCLVELLLWLLSIYYYLSI
jgi:hypothetical protein